MGLANAVAIVLALGVPVAAEPAPGSLGRSLQLDLGLAVVGAGFEQSVGPRFAVMSEAQIFSTYFLPWFDLGDRVDGFGGQLRATYFFRDGGRGPYATTYVRVNRVTADGIDDSGVGFSAGACGGYVFGLGSRVDLRVGAGAQYLDYAVGTADVSTPFVQLDLVVGYRL